MSEILTSDVLGLLGGDLPNRSKLFYPNSLTEKPKASVESRVHSRFSKLRELGSIALVDGAFDVPHLNHELYLLHCKLIGALEHFRALYGKERTFHNMAQRIESHPNILDEAQLAVTVDADERIAFKKSAIEAKGGVQRPIYPWIARADRVAGYSFNLNNSDHKTVDLVTVEGDSIHKGTPLESSLILAGFLRRENLLDTFIVFGEHDGTVDKARSLGLDPKVIAADESYAFNPQTDEPWSSSDIIRRAQGRPVLNPITRPEGL